MIFAQNFDFLRFISSSRYIFQLCIYGLCMRVMVLFLQCIVLKIMRYWKRFLAPTEKVWMIYVWCFIYHTWYVIYIKHISYRSCARISYSIKVLKVIGDDAEKCISLIEVRVCTWHEPFSRESYLCAPWTQTTTW